MSGAVATKRDASNYFLSPPSCNLSSIFFLPTIFLSLYRMFVFSFKARLCGKCSTLTDAK